MTLGDEDLKVMQSVLRRHQEILARRNERSPAYDRVAANIASALAVAADGSEITAPRHTEYVDVATAAMALGKSERWLRNIAPRIGGIKKSGVWLIPRDSLPDMEEQ